MVNIPSSKTTGQRFWVRPALCPQAARHWVTSLRMWLLTGNITSLQTIIKLVAIHLLISSGTTLSEYTIQYNTVQYSTIQYNTLQSLQRITIHCNILQYITIHCIALLTLHTLKYVTLRCMIMQYISLHFIYMSLHVFTFH